MSIPVPEFRRAVPTDVPALETLQRAAYAPNRAILGVEPLPLLADYAEIAAKKECWLVEIGDKAAGALILEPQAGSLLIWSVAIHPAFQGRGLGAKLMAFAEGRAREAGFDALTLYTGQKLEGNIAWYRHLGYAVTGIEQLADRNIVHMRKRLAQPQ